MGIGDGSGVDPSDLVGCSVSTMVGERTMDFGGRSFLNLARTTPMLPCARATCGLRR